MATGGLEMAMAIVAGLFAGQWLDTRWHTAPVLVILGVFGGAAVGFYNLYRMLTTADRLGRSRAKPPGPHDRSGNRP